MAQWVKRLTLDFGSGCDLTVVGLSPVLDPVLSVEPAWDSLSASLFLSAPPLHVLSLSLKINK